MDRVKGKVKGGNAGETAIWPYLFLIGGQCLSYWIVWLPINILILSEIIWPGQPLAADKIGVIYGTGVITVAIFRFVFGPLVDRYNRKKMVLLFNSLASALILLHAFIVEGGGDTSFWQLLLLTILLSIVKGGTCEGEAPVTNSIIDDSIDESKKSQAFGMVILIVQVTTILASFVAASVFKPY